MTADLWTKQLKRYLRKVRERDPVPARSTLSPAQEFQCRILGGHLIQWLEHWGPELMAERNALPITRGETDKPLVVFVTDTPGLVAAAEILGDQSDRIAYCRLAEFDAFPGYEQDDEFMFHCELHSYFDGPVDAELEERALTEHPPGPDEELWLHHDSFATGPLQAKGGHHVWFWNGSEARLAAEDWNPWIS